MALVTVRDIGYIGLWWPVISWHRVSLPDAGNNYIEWHVNVRDIVSSLINLPMMFLSAGFLPQQNGLDMLSRSSFILDLYTWVISRSVAGLETDSPCGIWGFGMNV